MRQPRGLWECPICDATELRDDGEDPPICEACRDSDGPIVEMRPRGPERETLVTDGGSDAYTSDQNRFSRVKSDAPVLLAYLISVFVGGIAGLALNDVMNGNMPSLGTNFILLLVLWQPVLMVWIAVVAVHYYTHKSPSGGPQ